MTDIDDFVADVKRRGWEAEPMDRALAISRRSPVDSLRLACRIVDELPKGGTYQDAALTYVALDDWPELVAHAIAAFTRNRKNKAAEAVVEFASLQCVQALHPHLPDLFELAPNEGSTYETWPWRGAGDQVADHLCKAANDRRSSAERRRKAWMCLLETRNSELLRWALDHVKCADLNLQMRRLRLPESLTVNSYLHEVGFEATSNGLRQLYADGPRHLIFADGYLDERAGWQDHPTWHLPENAPATQIDIGGDGNTNCGHCGGRTHRLVRFAHVDHLPFVMGVESLSIETCLSCLGWEDPRVMFYRHSDNGLPTCLAEHGGPPQFPAVALQQTTVQMVDMGPRWHWQYWGATNSVENLHRIGGHPTWIQSAEYPQCPGCHSTMCFLLQLDSNLPTMDEGDWLWGSGGIVYVFWCTACRISAMLWQCT